MARVLVAFHSSEGQTALVAERIAQVLRDDGDDVDVHELATAPAPDDYVGVVLGDSIHMGRHSRPMLKYLERHVERLHATRTALFQVSMSSAYPDDEHTAEAQRTLHQLLEATGLDPDIVAVFAGALVYTKYGWVKRHVMRSIERRQGGDTDTSRDYEYTDWDAVEHFAHDIHAMVSAPASDRDTQLDT